MEEMQWNDVLATGIQTIDEQHKRIVDLVNQLRGAIERDDAEIAEHVLTDLVDYTVYHFSFEEELMEQSGYAMLPLHRRVHQLFTARIPQFQQRYAAGEDVLEELHDMLVRWLLHHIQNDDRSYADSVKEHLHEPPPKGDAAARAATAAPPPPRAAHPSARKRKRSLWKRIMAFFSGT